MVMSLSQLAEDGRKEFCGEFAHNARISTSTIHCSTPFRSPGLTVQPVYFPLRSANWMEQGRRPSHLGPDFTGSRRGKSGKLPFVEIQGLRHPRSMSLARATGAAITSRPGWAALPAELLHEIEQGHFAEECKTMRLVRDTYSAAVPATARWSATSSGTY